MALSKEKERVQVVLSKELASRIDYYCNKMGMSRSAFCTQAIGEKIMGYDKSFEMIESFIGNTTKQHIPDDQIDVGKLEKK